ncbi:related to GIR2 Highly acidic protein with anomalous electrophoretic behavior [Cephalotrichum gorgonifer]|uniref:Related to GIR2 Highly acidic protein with anomalous electrophoretic behavior n=1 Tax=Cephalotrichum gorgonifer TaxID=2041049 RepID=A0AAE8SRE7_9PEZI|nr:related to GIR2 Highly acidic protein with anomalous electrophoretic behavior [Cephalotrichum gorgonifer]
MGHDEQVEELEVLESIFPEELTKISDTEFRISVSLDLPQEDSESPAEQPTILLQIRYPEDYPDKAPHFDLVSPPNAVSHPHFSLSDDREALLKTLGEVAEDNLGMAMIFTLVSSLKDEAEMIVAGRVAELEKEREEQILAAERAENAKFHGTPVNPETFMRWREGFIKEMEEKAAREEEERLAEMKKAKVKEPVRMTGRELWEKGLAGKAVDEDADDDEVVDGVQKLNVEA